MAKAAAHSSALYADEFALHGYLSAYRAKVMQPPVPVTCFQDTGPRRLVVNHDHELAWTGFGDYVADAIDDAAYVDLMTDEDHYFGLCPGHAATEGEVVYEQIARLNEQVRSGEIAGAQIIEIAARGSGGISRGVVLGHATIAGTQNRTGRNQGATSAHYQVVFRVVSVSGAGSLTLVVQESSDNGSGDAYAAISGLSATFTAVGAQRAVTTASTEAWKRCAVTAFSGFTSALVVVTGGSVAGT